MSDAGDLLGGLWLWVTSLNMISNPLHLIVKYVMFEKVKQKIYQIGIDIGTFLQIV